MNTDPAVFHAGRPRRSLPVRWLARTIEPVASRVAGTRWFPVWAILRHTGRTSGKRYATPVVALRTPAGFVIPLPFGDATQWARNLFAAGGGSIDFAGRHYAIEHPEIIDGDAAAAHLPRVLRFVAGRIGLRQFVLVHQVPTTPAGRA
jgi:deazaflavin-dependent oxidoreductase (nitroreductase family)